MKTILLILSCCFLSVVAPAQATLIGLDGQIEIITSLKSQLEAGVTDKITHLELRDFDGHPVAFDSTHNRPYVINVWSTWCMPCIAEIPSLNEIKAACADCNVDFFAVSYTDDAYHTEMYLTSHPFTFRQLTVDREYVLSHRLANGLPTTLFVDAAGNVQYKIIGGSSDPQDQQETMDSFTVGLEKLGCIAHK